MMLRTSLILNFVFAALAACTPQSGDTDTEGATTGTEATDTAPTTGDSGGGACGCIDVAEYGRASYACAASSCGVVSVECDPLMGGDDVACFGSGTLISLDETALDCALDLLISGADGMVEWHLLDQGDGASGYGGAFLSITGGVALVRGYGGQDLGSHEDPAGFVALKSKAYFTDCKAESDPQVRFQCFREWSDEMPAADCDPADEHSEEI